MRLIIFSTLLIAGMLHSDATLAQSVSNNMTCQQAVSYYERNGRINTLASGNAVPIYGYTPVSQRSRMNCTPSAVGVKTKDKRNCTIAYKCAPRGR